MVSFIEHLPCAKPHFRGFAYIYFSSSKQPGFTGEETGSERPSNLPRVAELKIAEAGLKPASVPPRGLDSFCHCWPLLDILAQ